MIDSARMLTHNLAQVSVDAVPDMSVYQQPANLLRIECASVSPSSLASLNLSSVLASMPSLQHVSMTVFGLPQYAPAQQGHNTGINATGE